MADSSAVRLVPEAGSGKDKPRQFQRFRIDLRVRVFREGEAQARLGRSGDLSEGGLGAMMVADLREGEAVTLEFEGKPLLRPVRLQAVVRNRIGFRYGFEFLSLSREQRAIIQAAGLFLPKVA